MMLTQPANVVGKLERERRGAGDIAIIPAGISHCCNWNTSVRFMNEPDPLDINQPLFIALDRSSYGHRLSDTSIYKVVRSCAKAAGITKSFSATFWDYGGSGSNQRASCYFVDYPCVFFELRKIYCQNLNTVICLYLPD